MLSSCPLIYHRISSIRNQLVGVSATRSTHQVVIYNDFHVKITKFIIQKLQHTVERRHLSTNKNIKLKHQHQRPTNSGQNQQSSWSRDQKSNLKRYTGRSTLNTIENNGIRYTCLGWPFLPPMVVTIMWPVSVPLPSTIVASISYEIKKAVRSWSGTHNQQFKHSWIEKVTAKQRGGKEKTCKQGVKDSG